MKPDPGNAEPQLGAKTSHAKLGLGVPSLPPGYKQTEVGVIPEEWEVSPVRQKGEVLTGKALAVNAPGRQRPYLRTKNVFDGRIDIDDVLTMPMTDEQFAQFRIRIGDVLLNEGQSIELVGRCAMYQDEYSEPCAIQNALLRFRAHVGVSDKFASYLFRHCQHTGVFARIALQTTSVAHLGGSRFERLRLAWPTEPEQRAIAAALSDVDGLLGALDRLIAKKLDLKHAAMQQLLTGQTRLPGFTGEWRDTTLGEIGECIIGLTYKPENVVKHGLLVLRSSNVQNGRLAYDDNVYVNLEVSEHLYTQVGDLLICVRNGSRALIGKCAVIDQAAAALTFGAFMAMYRTRHWRFVVHAFQGDDIQRQIRDNIGATINQITNKDMKAFRIKLPPEDEQTAIATVLSDMDAELAALEQRREKTRALKQGMMQELLTGRTRLV
jgi:type I restriction enzyme S subunit